jgi:glycosyltransferase involved in cell wall biosynthesis
MACGNYVIARDNAFNREVTAGHGGYFADVSDLARQLGQIDFLGLPEGAGTALRERAESYYNWERIADAYRQVFEAAKTRASGAEP